MTAFRLKKTVHYGYLRPPGVYHDLSAADHAALAKYGVAEPATEEVTANEPTVATRQDDAAGPGARTHVEPHTPVDPLACPAGCRDRKPFKNEAALASHRKSERH